MHFNVKEEDKETEASTLGLSITIVLLFHRYRIVSVSFAL